MRLAGMSLETRAFTQHRKKTAQAVPTGNVRALFNAMLANVTLDSANWAKFQPQLNDFLSALPASKAEQSTWRPTYNKANEGLTIPDVSRAGPYSNFK